ncbi:MAG: nucleotide exchange factor GrpE [Alphaproteobacteria bacterium]|nr:nucleotide exchange factor GrpE [Alphaproteobacteria bacterium]
MTENQPQKQEDETEPKDDPSDEPLAADDALPKGDRLAALEAELAETKDRMLRAMADVENMRRRAARDTEEARKYAVTGFARELLEVADNLSRALQAVPDEVRESEQVKPLVEGIELTQKSLATCFERQKITKVDPAIGERFDHNRHQAMFETETAEHAPGSVVQVMQTGYVIADRLLRPALVGVAKKPAAQAPPANENATPDDDQRGQAVDTSA